MDPPYCKELERKVLCQLTDSSLLKEDGIIIIEASLDTELDYVKESFIASFNILTRSSAENNGVFALLFNTVFRRGYFPVCAKEC